MYNSTTLIVEFVYKKRIFIIGYSHYKKAIFVNLYTNFGGFATFRKNFGAIFPEHL